MRLTGVVDPNTHEVLWRYEETDGRYSLRGFALDETSIPTGGRLPAHAPQGAVLDAPTWLSEIVTYARLGSHDVVIPAPPPDVIVWFVTDHSYRFVRFSKG